MHRVDLARATGRPLLRGAHDRGIITQVVADLGRAWHGPPALLELTGPAGGRWTLGHGAPAATIRADTIDYLRALSGRNNHPTCKPTATPKRQPQPPPASCSDPGPARTTTPEPVILYRYAGAK
jgi:hypothetical protein